MRRKGVIKIILRLLPSRVSPFLTDELLSSIYITLPPSRCMAAEKLQLVRVLTS